MSINSFEQQKVNFENFSVVHSCKLSTEQEYGMPKRFLDLMEKCWSQDPKERPVISDIVRELEDLSNAEFNEAVQEESSSSSNVVSNLCDNFDSKQLSVHQGYVLEIAGEKIQCASTKESQKLQCKK